MEHKDEQLNVVLKIQDVEVFIVSNNQSVLIDQGTLNLAEMPAHNCYALSLNSFNYAVTREIHIMGKKLAGGETIYILPNVKGYYGVKIPAKTKHQQLDILELILQQSSELQMEVEEKVDQVIETKQGNGFVLKKAANYDSNYKHDSSVKSIIEEESRPAVKMQKEKVKAGANDTNEKQDQCQEVDSKTNKASNVVIGSSEKVAVGLKMVATAASEGITKAGQYLSRKFITKREKVEVKEVTQNRIKTAKVATNAVLVFTATQIKALIHMAKEIGTDLAQQFNQSPTGKKLEEKPAYQTAKVVGKTAVQATAIVYDGMYEALCTLGRGVGHATSDAVTYKYGEKAGAATQGAFDSAGNVGKIMKVVPMQAAKVIAGKDGKDANIENV